MINYEDSRQAYDDHQGDDEEDEDPRQSGVGCRQQ